MSLKIVKKATLVRYRLAVLVLTAIVAGGAVVIGLGYVGGRALIWQYERSKLEGRKAAADKYGEAMRERTAERSWRDDVTLLAYGKRDRARIKALREQGIDPFAMPDVTFAKEGPFPPGTIIVQDERVPTTFHAYPATIKLTPEEQRRIVSVDEMKTRYVHECMKARYRRIKGEEAPELPPGLPAQLLKLTPEEAEKLPPEWKEILKMAPETEADVEDAMGEEETEDVQEEDFADNRGDTDSGGEGQVDVRVPGDRKAGAAGGVR